LTIKPVKLYRTTIPAKNNRNYFINRNTYLLHTGEFQIDASEYTFTKQSLLGRTTLRIHQNYHHENATKNDCSRSLADRFADNERLVSAMHNVQFL
jgi:hypothetical protein